MRKRLPNLRPSFNFTIDFQGEKYDVTVGLHQTGDIGDLFINRIRDRTASKLSPMLDGVCRDAALLISLAIQHGADLENIRHALTRDDDNEPATIIGAIVDHLHKNGTPYDGNEPTDAPRNGPPHTPPKADPTGTDTDPAGPNDGGGLDTASAERPHSGSEWEWEDQLDHHTSPSRN